MLDFHSKGVIWKKRPVLELRTAPLLHHCRTNLVWGKIRYTLSSIHVQSKSFRDYVHNSLIVYSMFDRMW